MTRHLASLALTTEEEAALPALTPLPEGGDFYYTTDPLERLGGNLGVGIVQRHRCVACDREASAMHPHFTLNMWKRRGDGPHGARCKACVRSQPGGSGAFPPNPDPSKKAFAGWPKCPVQVMWERGWIPSDGGAPGRPDLGRVDCATLGKTIVASADAPRLLGCFEEGGFWGYGGLAEGLCCLPGCREEGDDKLRMCSGCNIARYCCVDHQRAHYKLHKEECC